jgi:hypothetical protein
MATQGKLSIRIYRLGLRFMATSIARWLMMISAAACAMPALAAAPAFADYPVVQIYEGPPRPVNISSNPRAKRFRTALRDGALSGPNFAGHYTVVTWGCGVACEELAIVDAGTGRVHFPKSIKLNAYQLVTDGSAPFQFEKNSKLLVLTGSPNDTDELGIFYYIWAGSDLKRVYAENKVWPR